MENELKKLGLTDNEIAMYLAVLGIGETTVGPLCKKLNMHRQVAYDSLEGLEKKNMIDRIIKGKRYHFRVASPQNLIKNIKKQELIVETLLPQINEKLKGQKKGQEIRVFEGPRALREFVLENDRFTPTGDTTYVITSGPFIYKKIMGKSFDKSNQLRVKRGVKTKIIYPENEREASKLLPPELLEQRFIANEHTAPTAFQVCFDSVILISYGSEIFFIQIKNEDFRQSYINYFNLLWRIAKK